MDRPARPASHSHLPMLRPALLLAVLPAALGAQHADTPTYARDVAPILFRNCTACHRPGGIGPMSLLTYADARDNSADIREYVSKGVMPPWHADAPHGTFSNERRLTDAEKQTIVRWVEGGTPEGNRRETPPAPTYSSSWTMGTPDAVFTMATEFEVPASGTIEYQYFEVPTGLTEDKWIDAIEILPGAREVVHHVLVYARPPAPAPGTTPPTPLPAVLVPRRDHSPPGTPPAGPVANPRPRAGLGALVASLAPGTDVMTFPAGTALRLRAGTVLVFQMHYTAHGHPKRDRTSVGVRFAKAPPVEEIRASSFVNGRFVIPPGAADVQVPAEIGFRDTVRVWGILPHTHLRGTRWEYRLTQPDGRSEVVLSVPKYDFNWQTYYMFARPLEILPGGKLESIAWYDNSAANRANPDPTAEVRWGDQTWEEMQYSGFLYTVNSRRLTPGR